MTSFAQFFSECAYNAISLKNIGLYVQRVDPCPQQFPRLCGSALFNFVITAFMYFIEAK